MSSENKLVVAHAPFWHDGSKISTKNYHIMIAALPAVLLGISQYGAPAVGVSDGWVEVKFGIGLMRKKFALSDIESCSVVRNRWWYGWGIRKIHRGWLFNVSGLDAVELMMRNGRKHRIGTDDPDGLCRSIQGKLGEGSR